MDPLGRDQLQGLDVMAGSKSPVCEGRRRKIEIYFDLWKGLSYCLVKQHFHTKTYISFK